MSVLYRIPVSTLMRCVPAWDLELMNAFLSVEPSPEERIERGIAEFTALWVSSKKPPGSEPSSPEDFMPYRKAWEPVLDLPDEDLRLMQALRRRAN